MPAFDPEPYIKAIDWFRLNLIFSWTISVTASGVLVFNHYVPWFDLSSGVKTTLFVLACFTGMIAVVSTGDVTTRRLRKRHRLKHLAGSEGLVLQRFAEKNALDCNFMTWENGVDSLESAGLLTTRMVADSSARDGGVRVCRIEPWVLKYARKHLFKP